MVTTWVPKSWKLQQQIKDVLASENQTTSQPPPQPPSQPPASENSGWLPQLWRSLPINPYYWKTQKEKQQMLTESWAKRYGLQETPEGIPVVMRPYQGNGTRLPYPESPEPVSGTPGERVIGEWAMPATIPGGIIRQPFTWAGELLPKGITSSALGQGVSKGLDILIGAKGAREPVIMSGLPGQTGKKAVGLTKEAIEQAKLATGGLQRGSLGSEIPKITPESAKPIGESISKELDIIYNGVQKGFEDIPDTMLFTDKKTGSTFAANSLEEAKTKLTGMRSKFEETPVPSVQRDIFSSKKAGISPPKVESAGMKPAAPVPPINPPASTLGGNADDIINRFYKAISSPKSEESQRVTDELISTQRKQRAGIFTTKVEELLGKGLSEDDSFHQALSYMKGSFKKQTLDLSQFATPEVKNALMQKIRTKLSKPYDIISTTQDLEKALSGGGIPRKVGVQGGSAYTRLVKVFGEDFVKAIENPKIGVPQEVDPEMVKYLMSLPTMGKQSALTLEKFTALPITKRMKIIQGLKTVGLNIEDALGIPKAVKFAFDFSMMFRQLGISGARHPVSWLRTWKPYFQAMRSEKVALELDNMLRVDPTRMEAIHKLGLDLYDVKLGATYWNRPETMASKIAERYIPGVRMSNRGAGVAVNYFMTDVGKGLVKSLDKIKVTPDEYKTMGSLINELVGRGEMPKFLKGTAGDILNKLLSSPRYMASRFEWPVKLLSSSKAVRQEAWSTLISFAGVVTSILTMAKLSGLAEIEGDPRSADTLKIRIGNKRIDLWVGYAQIYRAAAQLSPYVDKTGKIDWTVGSRKTADGKIVPIPRGDVLARFAQSKESPAIGAIVTLLTGKNYVGQKVDFSTLKGWGKFGLETFSPASLQEMGDAYALEGLPSAALSSIGLSGIGVSTYSSEKVTPPIPYKRPSGPSYFSPSSNKKSKGRVFSP